MKKGFLAAGLVAAITLSAGTASAADAAKGGEILKKKCFTCHYFEAGGPGKIKKTGPYLFGVYGRQAGTFEGFKYSPGYVVMGEKGVKWTDDNLKEYLADPKPFVAKNSGDPKARSNMSFKLPSAEERDDVVAFLKDLK